MTILIYVLTIVLGIACFRMNRTRRNKISPPMCLIVVLCFIVCGIVSILSLTIPYGILAVYPLGSILLGLLLALTGVHDLYALLHCREKVDGVYCYYNTYYGGNAISTQAPVFEYTYNGTYYRQQAVQTVSYKRLNKSMKQGNVYSIYIDPKRPAVFILIPKFRILTIVEIILGLLILKEGIDLSLVFLPMLLGR